ncbi:glycosyl transferase family protein [Variovorax sp. J22R133]|uniref:glycosyl transferase family protein n=1 Tax=Variovorax brevis TaxID=3053503 RepID=UPI0025771619|nr:glycosyl transferase family protein [Variovorax sp. J22R133]MDM0110820.1 glycosyl transferase family protein [Variovorax sp. J22R133]
MTLDLVDFLAFFWFCISMLLRIGIVIILISSIDDFFIDLHYWLWRLAHWRNWRRSPELPAHADVLYQDEQQHIAIMIPAWQEAPVIARMADYLARSFDYERYHVFIGTYPNDAETQAEVDKVVTRYPHIHKVVTSRPGPTTKADCLNHVIAAITDFETQQGLHFGCLSYHDAEDVVHPLELRVFNHLVPHYDLVQLPVMPLVRRWTQMVGNHYVDEFAEWHGKDLLVRQHLTGQVPSAGVGTAFSRNAIALLQEINSGRVFDDSTLTEDYEIGVRLHEVGAREMLVHYPVRFEGRPPAWFGRPGVHDMVCVQEYFPDSASRAVRQKARWVVGIVFQSWRKLGWRGGLGMRYVLMRDRKSVLAFPSLLLGYLIVVVVLLRNLHEAINPTWWRFPHLIPPESIFWTLALVNFVFMLNRLLQRFICTQRFFGFWQAVQSVPRMVVGNLINIGAFFRAFSLTRRSERSGRPVHWDKTHHVFPDLHAGEHEP